MYYRRVFCPIIPRLYQMILHSVFAVFYPNLGAPSMRIQIFPSPRHQPCADSLELSLFLPSPLRKVAVFEKMEPSREGKRKRGGGERETQREKERQRDRTRGEGGGARTRERYLRARVRARERETARARERDRESESE